MTLEIPITEHPALPDEVPLIADFHDDRNRLSYYYPIVDAIESVQTPETTFVAITGDADTFLDVDCRDLTKWMQDIGTTVAFIRTDFSSAKYNGEDGSVVRSQDPYTIRTEVTELFRQCSKAQRHIGGRVAMREYIPHDREIRYFIRNGSVYYVGEVLDDGTIEMFPDDVPDSETIQAVADTFDVHAWSVDFIQHEETGDWYLIDMGLDGLYPNQASGWTAISGHLDPGRSPQQYADDMPDLDRFTYPE